MATKFSALLKHRRKQLHLTQSQAAVLMKVKRQSYAAWENGITAPAGDRMDSLLKAFHLKVIEMPGTPKLAEEENQNDKNLRK